MAEVRTRQQYYEIYKNAATSIAAALTDWAEGSINDCQAGAASSMADEISNIILTEFTKTFIDSANSDGDTDDLENLLVDHFGDDFERPEAQKAVGTVKFSRPSAGAGDVTIPVGTVVKTPVNANGESTRFETLSEVIMTSLEINASIRAIEAGTSGNVDSDEITEIESSLTDTSITVNNDDETSGGSAEYTDEEYREWARNKIITLKGGITSAIEAVAKTVSGVEKATAIEKAQTVIEYNIGTSSTVGDPFTIPHSHLYVADVNGEANDALLELVIDEIKTIRACGVRIDVHSAVAQSIDWDAELTLDAGGPNYSTLQSDTTMIKESMTKYINDLAIGDDFIREYANDYILSVWGPSGTGDLTSTGFVTKTPTGDVSIDENEKAIAGTMDTI